MKIVLYGPRSDELEAAMKKAYQGPSVDIQNPNTQDPIDMDFCLGSLSFPGNEQCIILVQVSVLGTNRDTAENRLREIWSRVPLRGRQLGSQVYILHDEPGEDELAESLANNISLSLTGLLSNPKSQLVL